MKKLKWTPTVRLLRFLSRNRAANTLTAIGIAINFLLLLVTFSLALGAFLQWRALDKTLCEMHKQTPAILASGVAAQTSATTAQTALETSQRPWIVISSVRIPGGGINSFGLISYEVTLSVNNTGLTPATNSAILADMTFGSSPVQLSIPQQMENTCHKLDKVGPLAGVMVPPQQKNFALNRQFNIATTYIPLPSVLKTANIDPQSGDRHIAAQLITCVLYRSELSKQVHHTAQIYDVQLTLSKNEAEEIQKGLMVPGSPIFLDEKRFFLHKNDVINDYLD